MGTTPAAVPAGGTGGSSATAPDAFGLALEGFEHFMAGDFEPIAGCAAAALASAHDPDALALARAVAGLAAAGRVDAAGDPALADPVTGSDPLLAAVEDPEPLTGALRAVLLHLLAEAALACARLDLAARFVDRAGPLPETLFGSAHPYLTVMRVLRVRVRAFQGRISDARALADIAVERAVDPVGSLFATAAAGLVHGNADERKGTRAIAEIVESSGIRPTSALTRGCFLLAAYGTVAVGDVGYAAKLVLAAGDGPGLEGLMLIDRALGLELLVAAAVAAEDLDAAESWLVRLAPLEGHPICASTVDRATSRVALLAGDTERAERLAARAVETANAEGRRIEAAEGEIVLARARIALAHRGEAAHALERVVTAALGEGHLAVRRAAARELREIGRRLPPAVASGLDGLSSREREVAALLAEGLSNASIARELFLSQHTVRVHVSRVLHAFGVATRTGVAAALGPALGQPGASIAAPPLTTRQREVADLIATGASNAAIGARLGIGVKTVEKHVSDILRRWSIASRAGIAMIAVADRGREESPDADFAEPVAARNGKWA